MKRNAMSMMTQQESGTMNRAANAGTSVRMCRAFVPGARLAGAVVAMAALAPAALGQMTLETQARSISVNGGPCGSQSLSAPGFAPFVQTVRVGSGAASQSTTLSSALITGTGGTSRPAGGPCTGITGSSSLNVTFSIAQPTNYIFQYGATLLAPVQISLTGPNTNIAFNIATMGTTPQTATGVFQPGVYTLSATANAGPQSGTLTPTGWSINLSASVPSGACCTGLTCTQATAAECTGRFVGAGAACNAVGNVTTPCCRADVDQSGTLSVQDIFTFLNAWFQRSVGIGNYNGDCCVSTQDIFDYLAAYFAGC